MYVQTDGTSGLGEITVTFPDGTVKRFDTNYRGNIPFPAAETYSELPAYVPSPPAPNRHERRREAKFSRLRAAARPHAAAREGR